MSPCPQAASNPAGVSGFSLPRGSSGKGMFKTGVPLGDAGSEPCRRKTYAKKSPDRSKIRREGPGLRSG